ncbi:XdhC family protein [Microbacterium sp.]|uniref:XdhC family protein n=1 Tax=Microbacterium sp. TaxID=51671 RepID=UPI002E376007|nr:XdhC family protein [Microbacterium sp.]HEX5728395.1 XdhC family protein [Microbacterium sp.]
MLELAADLLPRLRAGERIAVVTVTRVSRSAPRGAGASMAVTEGGEVIGSISGGCVESDAVLLAVQALATGRGATARFGFSDADAHAAGLACGGAIDVIAYSLSLSDAFAVDALEAVLRDEPVAVGLVISAEPLDGAGGSASLGRLVPVTVDGLQGGILTLSHQPRPRLVVLGAGDYAAALCRAAAVGGFAVTVCDAWGLLVTPERFPDADDLVIAPPDAYLREVSTRLDPRTAICVLTHDERQDVPALREALRLPVAFVGALGARRTVARRAQLLREQGVTDDELARLHSPLGLDLGAETPEETAISILAEIVAARRSGTGAPLRDLATPIHSTLPPAAHAPESGSCSVADSNRQEA